MATKFLAVVSFVGCSDPEGKPLVDVVPYSWVRKAGNGYVCSYPPPPYFRMDKMVRQLASPGLTWKEYPVNYHSSTVTYEDGVAKVEKFTRTLSATTDDDKQNHRGRPYTPHIDDVPKFPNRSSEVAGASPSNCNPEDEQLDIDNFDLDNQRPTSGGDCSARQDSHNSKGIGRSQGSQASSTIGTHRKRLRSDSSASSEDGSQIKGGHTYSRDD